MTSMPPMSPFQASYPDMIYLDYQATTPCDPRVVTEMIPYFSEVFGNPHSRNHIFGWDGENAVEDARCAIADLIGAGPKEIVFTSGATESNNMAIKGVARFYGQEKKHIITVVTEHKCVLDSCRHLEQEGFRVTYLPVGTNGILDLDVLRSAITPDTSLVSVMAVNNEIGVIQPISEIGAICRERGVFFHTDAAQAVGKIPLNVHDMNIDLMSLSGHKMYGPKGVGALYVGRKPRVRLTPLISGGGQERGMRSGTLSPALCVGMGAAARVAKAEMAAENDRLTFLKNRFLDKIESNLSHVYLNGDRDFRVPGSLNISFAFVEGEGLMMGIKDLAVSSGSACTSASLEPSYVLRALGVDEELAHTSLRIGFGRFTTQADVDTAADKLIRAVTRLRVLSPLWEMVQDGVDLKSIKWSNH